ncbi:hypothetical protein [Halobacteriovorax sp. HLS]|uniref:hypothetical protein n=1 Tax=Halobacteriovorax sp. HLS TaxID=2234000 RepID=UPI000FDBF4AB|nr:hypothetical protein [Halobacteriovorax sp. HLS]
MSNALLKEDIESVTELFLNQEQLESGQYALSEVFHLSIDEKEYGPIWQQDIKEFLQRTNNLNEQTKLKSLDSQDWQGIYDHPLFQRRRPQLVSTHSLDEQETTFQVLKDGQVRGPFTLFEISSMVEKNEILLVDEVSIDEGASWGHLYEIEEFDRRTLKSNEQLPNLPKEEFLNSRPSSTVQDEKTNLIAGLAYIGNLKTGKAKAKTNEASNIGSNDEYEFNSDSEIEASSSSSKIIWAVLFVTSLAGLYFVLSSWNTPTDNSDTQNAITTNSSDNTNTSQVQKAKMLKPVKLKPTIIRPSIEKSSKVNDRPTSFTRSKAFRQAAQKKKMADDARITQENDDYYYDDNTDPVELDPVRRTLSKETIDPEFQDEFMDEERAPASDEVFNEEAEF